MSYTKETIIQCLSSTLNYYSNNPNEYSERIALNEVLTILPDNDAVSELFEPAELSELFGNFQSLNILALMYEMHDHGARYESAYPAIMDLFTHFRYETESFTDAFASEYMTSDMNVNVSNQFNKEDVEIIEMKEESCECECAICFECVVQQEKAVIKECNHGFCVDCISKLKQSVCPLCRAEIKIINVFTEDAKNKILDIVVI